MNLDELEEHIWNGLQELGRHKRMVHDIMKQRDTICCVLHTYDIFFSSIYWATNNFLVVRICRITDEKNKKGLTFGRWLETVIKENGDSVDIVAMQGVLKDYRDLLKSEQYINVRRLRNQEYVHDDETYVKSEDVEESDPTWKDLFEIIEDLQKLRNKAAAAGACTTSMWINDMPEPGQRHLLKVLEKAAHKGDMHDEIIKQES